MRAERSVAVLWATHLCDEVAEADRVIVLHHGKVLADTTPAELVARAGDGNDRAGVSGDDGRVNRDQAEGKTRYSWPPNCRGSVR